MFRNSTNSGQQVGPVLLAFLPVKNKIFPAENNLLQSSMFEYFKPAEERRYISSGELQADHSNCLGFRYTVAREQIKLTSYLMEEEGAAKSR
jgi:hypothetical protein